MHSIDVAAGANVDLGRLQRSGRAPPDAPHAAYPYCAVLDTAQTCAVCAVRARYEQSTCSPDEIALRIRTLFSDRLAAKSACSAVRNSGSGGRSFRPKAPQEAALRIPFSRAADGGVPAQFFVCRNSFLDCAFRDGAIRKACHLVPFSAISKYAVFSEPTRSGRCHSFQNSPAMLLVRFDRSIRDRRVLT